MKQIKTALNRIFGKYPKLIMICLNMASFYLLYKAAKISLSDPFTPFYIIPVLFILVAIVISIYIIILLLNSKGDESISPIWMSLSLLSMLFIVCIFFATLYAFFITYDKCTFNESSFSVEISSGTSSSVKTPSEITSSDVSIETINQRAIDLLYFSVVTFTTLGYGDIYPVAWYTKIVVMIESFTFSVLIAFIFMNVKMKENTSTKENTNLTENGETKENGEK